MLLAAKAVIILSPNIRGENYLFIATAINIQVG